jgi:hypothetical protein
MDRNARFSPEDARRLANSEDAQHLLALLQRDNGEQLKAAMEQVSVGDYAQVKRTLSQALSDPEVRALLERMGGQYGG